MVLYIIFPLLASTLFFQNQVSGARSYHRPNDPLLASLEIQEIGTDKVAVLRNAHLSERAIFCSYDKDYFFAHLFPQSITYRHQPTKTIGSQVLFDLNEKLLQEIENGQTEYSDFIILKDRDFRKKARAGCLILKYKNYPFILKLFIETPESFADPFSKGFEPICFFMMGDGINRHLNGFGRIKNKDTMQWKVSIHPHWSHHVDFPRKWFWLPQNARWLRLTGTNIGGPRKVQDGEIPAVYGIICDKIDIGRDLSLNDPDDRQLALSLSNYLGYIDPHIKNFVIEKQTNKIVPIDSENFLYMVGFDEPQQYNGYMEWYCKLTQKMVHDTFGRTKLERRNAQFAQYELH
jgi:hypothetical protein